MDLIDHVFIERVLRVAQIFVPGMTAEQLILRLLVDPTDDSVHAAPVDLVSAALTHHLRPKHDPEVEHRFTLQVLSLDSLRGKPRCGTCLEDPEILLESIAHLVIADITSRYSRAEQFINSIDLDDELARTAPYSLSLIHQLVVHHTQSSVTTEEIINPYEGYSQDRFTAILADMSDKMGEALQARHRQVFDQPQVHAILRNAAKAYSNAGDETTLFLIEALSVHPWWTSAPRMDDPGSGHNLLAILQVAFAPETLDRSLVVSIPRWAAETIRSIEPAHCRSDLYSGLDHVTADTAARLFIPDRSIHSELYSNFDTCVTAARSLQD
jgi:hypothetical protein